MFVLGGARAEPGGRDSAQARAGAARRRPLSGTPRRAPRRSPRLSSLLVATHAAPGSLINSVNDPIFAFSVFTFVLLFLHRQLIGLFICLVFDLSVSTRA